MRRWPMFQRFDCKVFLTEALRYFSGAPTRVMIDNTHVVVLHGTGLDMIPVPEMTAFAVGETPVSWRLFRDVAISMEQAETGLFRSVEEVGLEPSWN